MQITNRKDNELANNNNQLRLLIKPSRPSTNRKRPKAKQKKKQYKNNNQEVGMINYQTYCHAQRRTQLKWWAKAVERIVESDKPN